MDMNISGDLNGLTKAFAITREIYNETMVSAFEYSINGIHKLVHKCSSAHDQTLPHEHNIISYVMNETNRFQFLIHDKIFCQLRDRLVNEGTM